MKTYIATHPKTSETHRFESQNRESAEAYCLMHGLEIQESRVKSQETSRQSDEPTYYKGNYLLSKKQKAVLCQLAAGVFSDLDDLGLIDEPAAPGESKAQRLTKWRRSEVKKATGKTSLTKCRNSDYRKLHNHFALMTGKNYNPQNHCTGPQTNQRGDTMERREQIIALIEEELMKHARVVTDPANGDECAASQIAQDKGGSIGAGYFMSIAIAKNKSANLSDLASLVTLPARQLEQLHYTLRNRIAGREGRGEVKKRNKKQRGGE